MNKVYKRHFKESERSDEFNGMRVKGVKYRASSLERFLDAGLLDAMMDGDLSVSGFEPYEIEELHIYNNVEDFDIKGSIWPEAEVKGKKIILRSAFGWGKEDECICNQVKIV